VHAFLLSCAFKRIFHEVQPKFLIHTFEQNPWERGIHLAREKYSFPVVGFQHTVVQEIAWNLFVSPNKGYVPDIVLTSGLGVYEQLKKLNLVQGIPIIIGHGFRFFEKKIQKPKSFKPKLIIALDGLKKCKALIQYTVYHAKKNPEIEFAIRPHPTLLFKRDIAKIKLSNVTLDQNTLEDSLAECMGVCYWGSTVCLEAINQGKPVFHVRLDQVFSMDPLYFFKFPFRYEVSYFESLTPYLQVWKESSPELLDRVKKEGEILFNHYFSLNDRARESLYQQFLADARFWS